MVVNQVCDIVFTFQGLVSTSISLRWHLLVCKDSESELEKLKKKYGSIHQHFLQQLVI